MSLEYLGEEAIAFPLSLALEEVGFGLVGGLEMGDATGDFGAIATDKEPIGFAREPNSDFGSGEFGPLGSVSTEDKSDASLIGLTTLAFFFDPLGIGGEGVCHGLCCNRGGHELGGRRRSGRSLASHPLGRRYCFSSNYFC